MSKRLNLVTGAAGFSGSHLVKLLLDKGEKVIATDLEAMFQDEKKRLIFKGIGLDLEHPNLTVIPADINRKETLGPLFDQPVTHFFHVASLYNYSAKMSDLRRINIDGFCNVADLACEAGLERFVHWSTCGVFGRPYPPSKGSDGNTPFTEESPSPKNTAFGEPGPRGTQMVNDYSVTKWEQEQLAWKYHRERNLPLTVLRPGPLYGPGSSYGHGGIVLAIHKGYLPVVPTDAKNYVTVSCHVEDMGRFADFISRNDKAIGEDFNVVDDSIISHYDFIRYIGLLLGRRMVPVPWLNLQLMRPLAIRAAKLWTWLEESYNVPRLDIFEVQSAEYFGKSYWISNKKSKDWGFNYRYSDVREGLRHSIEWFQKMGWM